MLEKIIIISRREIPINLIKFLRLNGIESIRFEDVSDVDFSNIGTVVVDVSMNVSGFKMIRDNIIPSSVTSFFFDISIFYNFNACQSMFRRFLSKIGTDISINHRMYDFRGEAILPTDYGEFVLFGFENKLKSGNNVIGLRTKTLPNIPVVRAHSMCYTGDIFHSLKCDCREELDNALDLINREGGMLIYPEEEGRGIGILNKIQVYQQQDKGADTVDAQFLNHFPNDLRTYDYLKDVFVHYEISSIKLITNSPSKIMACSEAGVTISEVIKMMSTVTKYNRDYLKTKMIKNGHNFEKEFHDELD